MQEVTEMFEVASSLKVLVEGAWRNFRCGRDDEMSLRGCVDYGRGRAHYTLVDLTTELQWDQYKRLVEKTNVASLEVVVDISRRVASNDGFREDLEFMPQGATQESTVSQLGLGASQQERLEMEEDDEFEVDIANDSLDKETFEMEEADSSHGQFGIAMARDHFPIQLRGRKHK
ncbi:hypothetical protein HU200_008365 [Digitaria exilis]|uniref:Uncharacterized protein n=1 Tax=Digitaria exilis TaxID=1010633 RepID=A0A835FLC2_9POAL|nr:hypothetical protein HU200_008365 [Digitaria exilis]